MSNAGFARDHNLDPERERSKVKRLFDLAFPPKSQQSSSSAAAPARQAQLGVEWGWAAENWWAAGYSAGVWDQHGWQSQNAVAWQVTAQCAAAAASWDAIEVRALSVEKRASEISELDCIVARRQAELERTRQEQEARAAELDRREAELGKRAG